jgi:hypothetical protein
MAISPISSQAVTQTTEIQKAAQTETDKNKPKPAPTGSGDAYTVKLSEEAQKKAQENAQQNPAVPQTGNEPSM